MGRQIKKPTIAQLEALLQKESDEAIMILPNGEIRSVKKPKFKKQKILTMKENLGGEYAFA